MVKLGTVLKACRERAEFSQEELAHHMNRTQACISKFENDHKVPDANTFMEWFRLTNTPEVAIAFLYGMVSINNTATAATNRWSQCNLVCRNILKGGVLEEQNR